MNDQHVALASLTRGLYARVAHQLGFDPSYVSRVGRGFRRSPEIEAALEREAKILASVAKASIKRNKRNTIALKQIHSIGCPFCKAGPGKRCRLQAGGLRSSPHRDRKLAAALLARLERELAKPHLTRSVRDQVTKKQLIS